MWRSHALEAVRGAFDKNWQAAMTFLERRYPNEFALRTVVRSINTDTEAHYTGLTREQLLAALETAQRVDLEAPKGFETKAIEG
jgi:hypothetical protein